MAGTFKPQDRVVVNGEDAEIVSWPASNSGAFRYRTWGRGGAAMEKTAFVKAAKVGRTDKPLSEGGGGQPVQQVIGAEEIKLVQAAPPPPPPKPIDPSILREIEREDAEAEAKKTAEVKATMAAMKADIRAELLAELRAMGMAPPAVVIDDLEREAVNREVHYGDVVAAFAGAEAEPEVVIEHEVADENDYAKAPLAMASEVQFDEITTPLVESEAPAVPAQPWGRGRAARTHREVSEE